MVLVRYLREAPGNFTPCLPDEAYEKAIHKIVQMNAAQSTLQTNREKHNLRRNGVKVTYQVRVVVARHPARWACSALTIQRINTSS